MIFPWFDETDQSLFFTKNDKADPRLGDLVKPLRSESQIKSGSTVILGYPDDEGIKLNGGRIGAAQGPEAIRKVLYKMTPPYSKDPLTFSDFFDAGNLKTHEPLEKRHQYARETVSKVLKSQARVLTLGGGHDYGFSDMGAFCEVAIAAGKTPVIVNFDAHMDVRPDDKGFNSGTPFYRLLNEFKNKIEFYEVGIQEWCNSRTHVEWARNQGAKIISLRDILFSKTTLTEILHKDILNRLTKKHALALSIDIDAFKSGSAPGASQVFPAGLEPQEFLIALEILNIQFRPALMSIYEVSPPFDLDQRTAKLAALLSHQFLFT